MRRKHQTRTHFWFGVAAQTLVIVLAQPLFGCVTAHAHGDVFRDCGGVVQGDRGVIHSPNFPDPFPDPISCTWILRAPPGKRIQVYFTQYFLRESFSISEFDSYTNPHVFQGRSDLGTFDFSDHVTTVLGYKAVLTLDFHVRGKKNIHLRVEEFLSSVYGFNITYEVVDLAAPRRNETCRVDECSFLGHCVAAADWSTYYCECFPGYYGRECQYGPHCDPRAGRNMCLNGGSCRYFYGSLVNMCDCPPGFTGIQCETRTDNAPSQLGGDCTQLSCSQLCKPDQQGQFACSCREGFSLAADNTSCQLINMHRVMVDVTTYDAHVKADDVTNKQYKVAARRQFNAYMQYYGLPRADRFAIDSFKPVENGGVLSFHFYTRSESVGRVQLLLSVLALRGTIFNLNTTADDLHVLAFPELQILGVEHYERRVAPEGGYANLMCRARGSEKIQFRWLKDGNAFNASLTARNTWPMYIHDTAANSHLSILNMNDITIYDKGEFTCEVEDFGDVQQLSLVLDVTPKPRVIATPLAASVNRGDSASFRCFSPDERLRIFHYHWLKNGEDLNPREHLETVEDLQPMGNALFIASAIHPANYTCIITSDVGSSDLTVHLFVAAANKLRCEGEKSGDVTWSSAMDGGFDVQKCPANMAGLASRACRCSSGTCSWSQPNLARCQTTAFIATFDKMEELRQGYQGQSIADILADLSDLLRNGSHQAVAGDVTLAARILLNGLTDARDIPNLLTSAEILLQPEVVLNLLDLILTMAVNATPEEKEEQRLLSRAIISLEILSELMGWAVPLPHNGSHHGLYLGVNVRDVVYENLTEQQADNQTQPSSQPSETNQPLPHQPLATGQSQQPNQTSPAREPQFHHQPSSTSELQQSHQPLTRVVPAENSDQPIATSSSQQDNQSRANSQAHQADQPSTVQEDQHAAERKSATEDHNSIQQEIESQFDNSSDTEHSETEDFTPDVYYTTQDGVLDMLMEDEEPVKILEVYHAASLKLLPLPPLTVSNSAEWVPLSGLRSLLPVGKSWVKEDFRMNLTFPHPHHASLFDLNETMCFNVITNRS